MALNLADKTLAIRQDRGKKCLKPTRWTLSLAASLAFGMKGTLGPRRALIARLSIFSRMETHTGAPHMGIHPICEQVKTRDFGTDASRIRKPNFAWLRVENEGTDNPRRWIHRRQP
jgi:hypothetical protein